MGFIGLPDYIGALTDSSSLVTLQPSLLTIGGQQYRTPTLTTTLSGLTVGTWYMLYVVMSGSTPQLVYSSNFNSVGPSGYSRWKLVGGFFADSSSTLSTFVENINESPKSSPVNYTPTVTFISGSMTNFTALGKWRRDGEVAKYSARILFNGSPGTWIGTFLSLPQGQIGNSTKRLNSYLGIADFNDAGIQQFPGVVAYWSTTQVVVYYWAIQSHTGSVPTINVSPSQSVPFAFGSGDTILMDFELPIVGWSNTPFINL